MSYTETFLDFARMGECPIRKEDFEIVCSRLNTHVNKLTGIFPGGLEVLDVCAGPNTCFYWQQHQPLRRLAALDCNKKMLRYNRAPEKHLGRLGEPLPFNDNEFSAVSMFFGSRYQDSPAYINELLRIVRPQGLVMLYDYKVISAVGTKYAFNPCEIVSAAYNTSSEALELSPMLMTGIGSHYMGPLCEVVLQKNMPEP